MRRCHHAPPYLLKRSSLKLLERICAGGCGRLCLFVTRSGPLRGGFSCLLSSCVWTPCPVCLCVWSFFVGTWAFPVMRYGHCRRRSRPSLGPGFACVSYGLFSGSLLPLLRGVALGLCSHPGVTGSPAVCVTLSGPLSVVPGCYAPLIAGRMLCFADGALGCKLFCAVVRLL